MNSVVVRGSVTIQVPTIDKEAVGAGSRKDVKCEVMQWAQLINSNVRRNTGKRGEKPWALTLLLFAANETRRPR